MNLKHRKWTLLFFRVSGSLQGFFHIQAPASTRTLFTNPRSQSRNGWRLLQSGSSPQAVAGASDSTDRHRPIARHSIDSIDSIFPLAATILVVGFLVLLPIIFCWYKAAEVSYFAKSTRFEGAAFELDTTLGSLLWLLVGNLLISISTLGFGAAFTQMRTFRYVCNRLHAHGIIDFDAIIQSSDKGPGFGEGLADAFDVGAV